MASHGVPPSTPPTLSWQVEPFWAERSRPVLARIPERTMYVRGPDRTSHPSFLDWTAAREARFTLVLLGMGFWGIFADQILRLAALLPVLPTLAAGSLPLLFAVYAILVDLSSSVLQVVVGAPVFEEFFKFGLAMVPALLLRGRSGWTLAARIVLGWLSGAAFGIFEHVSSYSGEETGSFVLRIAFHAGAAGLSMTLFALLRDAPSPRARWLSTLPSSLLHYGNNFFGPVLAILTQSLTVAEVWSDAMTVATFVLTASALLAPWPTRRLLWRQAHRRLLRPA